MIEYDRAEKGNPHLAALESTPHNKILDQHPHAASATTTDLATDVKETTETDKEAMLDEAMAIDEAQTGKTGAKTAITKIRTWQQ